MTKQITNIAQFKPLPKSRGMIGMYICEAANTTEAYAGEYSVRITFNGCAINAKTTLAINSCDNLYIKAFNPLTNVETNKLIRKPNVAAKNEYEDLILQVETLDGKIIKTLNYTWDPPSGVTLGTNQNEPYKVQINKLGRYTVQASSANGTSCPLSIDIFAEPCTVVGDKFECDSLGGKDVDANQTDLANLAVGDEFTTSDYTVVVTEASKTGTTFSGKGKLIFNFLKISNTLALQIPISVTFTGIKINQCYQLYNGSVITEYDPSWGSVVSPSELIVDASTAYKNATQNLKEIFKIFNGSCAEIEKIEKEIESIEKGLLTDNTYNVPTSSSKQAVEQLKAAYLELKVCAGCGISGARIQQINSDCESKVQNCILKTEVLENMTVLNNTWLLAQGCENIKKAVITPCSSTKIENCFKGGAVYVSVSSSSVILEGIKTNCSSELKDGQWLVFNNRVYDPLSFNTANIYNINNNKWDNYYTIEDRHQWYKWANEIARPRDNFWFAAAADVTSWRAVGGAEMAVNLGYITDPEEFLMKTINKHLLKQNFENFGPYVTSTTGKVKDVNGNPVNLSGVALAEKMVEIEQTEVQNYLPTAKNLFIDQFGNQNKPCYAASGTVMSQFGCAIYGINKTTVGETRLGTTHLLNIFTLGGAPNSIDKANAQFKISFPNIAYNFLTYEHRVFMGKEMAKFLRGNQ